MGELADRLREFLPEASLVSPANIFELGDGAGAYALIINLAEPVKFSRKALGSTELQGDLIYAGSANGPGGIKARLARHFKSEKAIRWHVDELTARAAAVSALAIMGGNECDIIGHLLETGDFKPAMPGFGSSDCSNCAAHLLACNAV